MATLETLRDAPSAPPVPPRTLAAVLGAHGGSGATTVARFLRMPEVGAAPMDSPETVRLVTARTTADGASSLLRVCGSSTAPLVVVWSADAPLREPPAVRAAARMLADRVALEARLPYVPAWRYGRPKASTATHAWIAAAAALLDSLTQLAAIEGATR